MRRLIVIRASDGKLSSHVLRNSEPNGESGMFLQEMQNWHLKARNFRLGDFVLLVERIVARGCWNCSVITDVILSDDDYVR